MLNKYYRIISKIIRKIKKGKKYYWILMITIVFNIHLQLDIKEIDIHIGDTYINNYNTTYNQNPINKGVLDAKKNNENKKYEDE